MEPHFHLMQFSGQKQTHSRLISVKSWCPCVYIQISFETELMEALTHLAPVGVQCVCVCVYVCWMHVLCMTCWFECGLSRCWGEGVQVGYCIDLGDNLLYQSKVCTRFLIQLFFFFSFFTFLFSTVSGVGGEQLQNAFLHSLDVFFINTQCRT